MKYCENCGQENPDDATFCAQCGGSLGAQATTPEAAPGAFTGGPGQPPPPPGAPVGPIAGPPIGGAQGSGQPPVGPPPGMPPTPTYKAPAETEPMAIASLALSIGGWFFCPLIFSILGVIFGYMARTKIRESGGRLQGDGLALAGLVIGWIGIAVMAIALIIILIVFVFIGVESTTTSLNQFQLVAALL